MFTHNVSCSSNKDKLEALQYWLKETEGIESEIKAHPIFELGLYTTKEDQIRAMAAKEKLEDLLNVMTGEVIFGTIHRMKGQVK